MKVLMIMLLVLTNIIAEVKDIAIENLMDDFYKATSSKDNEDLAQEVLDKLQKIVNEKYTSTRASYLGSITAKMAVYSFLPWSKMSYSEDGSKLLNRAIKEEPNNIHIRLNRMNAFINFPDFLKKEHFVQQDARWFIGYIKNKNINELNDDKKENIYKVLAMFFAKEKDENRYNKYFSQLTNDNFIKDVQDFKNNL
jgi:hypothetical protein